MCRSVTGQSLEENLMVLKTGLVACLCAAAFLLAAPSARAELTDSPVATFSIVAADTTDGVWGIAVASKFLAVGSVAIGDGERVWNEKPGKSFCGLFASDDGGKTWRQDVLFPSADPDNLVPYDSPVLVKGKGDDILALSVQVDRRTKDDPRSGWTMGSHYVLHTIRER